MARRKNDKEGQQPAPKEGATAGGPGPGHNSNAPKTELNDEQKQVLWFQHKKDIKGLRDLIASKSADLRNVYKKLKADLGITKAEADFAIALDNDEDNKMLESHRRMMELARWEQHPIGTQPDMFDGVDRTPAVDKAAARGKKDGLAGNPMDPQADPSTPQYGAYMTAFHEGNAELARATIKAPPDKSQLEAFAEDGLPDGATPPPTAAEEGSDAEAGEPATEEQPA
jgi:hypothetical protein